jgi:hypothetical protein
LRILIIFLGLVSVSEAYALLRQYKSMRNVTTRHVVDIQTENKVARPGDASQSTNSVIAGGVAYPTIAAAIAATPSGGTIMIPARSILTSSTISITKSNTRILCSDSTSVIAQEAANFSQIVISPGVSNVSIENCTFQGVRGIKRVGSNFAIQARRTSKIRILNNIFRDWQQDAVNCQDCDDLLIQDNKMHHLWGGILIQGGKQIRLVGNYLEQESANQNTVFVVAIQFDSANGGFGAVSDATVSGNTVTGYVNGQCILFHSGSHISITKNVCTDVLNGVILGPMLSTGEDNIADATITDNTAVGTLTKGAGLIANQGIALNGLKGGTISHVTIAGNTVTRFNGVVKSDTQGAIQLNWVDDVTASNNTIRQAYGNGINIAASATRLAIQRNRIENVQFASTVRNGIMVQPHTLASGKIQENYIQGTNDGLRFDSKNPALLIGLNHVKDFTNSKINNSSNVTMSRSRDNQ